MIQAGLCGAEIRACRAHRLCALLSATRDFCGARATSTLRNVEVGYGSLRVFPFFDGRLVESPRAANPKSGNPSLPKQSINGGGMNPQMPRQLGDCQYVTVSSHRVSLPRADLASEIAQAPPRIEDEAKIPVGSQLCQGTIRGIKHRAERNIAHKWVRNSDATPENIRTNAEARSNKNPCWRTNRWLMKR